MAISLEQFVKHLEDSGILADGSIANFLPPKGSPKDGEDLARELVRNKKLTKYQAEEIYKGKGKSLTLGNYVLIEKIGAGGMGQVFKAEHRRMHRMVAIKLLPTALTKDKLSIARFEREVMAAAKVRHPNIVAADDADQANGVHFLVMELVEGSDLSALVKKNGPLAPDKAINYILQVARGLEFAHAEGIVHRDIKPANLLLDKKGTVKILDMGLARIDGDVGQTELTSTGAVMGTVDYMAPEQAVNSKTADARADIYALGCSLYFLLTGKAAYSGDTLMAKLLAHRDHPIPDLRADCPEVPDQLEAIFKTMVAKNIEDRYQSMTAIIADLESCAAGPTVNPPSFATSDPGLTNFLKDLAVPQNSIERRKSPPPTRRSSWPILNGQTIAKHKQMLLIGGGVLGALALLASLILIFRTKEGTLIVTVSEADAEVQILNVEGKVEFTRKANNGAITIPVVAGKHRLKVQKEGFEPFADIFEITNRDEKLIAAKLVPLKKIEVAAGKPWETPDFKKWMKSVAALPVEKQAEAVSKKLKEFNPEFDGKLSAHRWAESSPPMIEDGNVVELMLYTENISDLSPIRAFSELKRLSCLSKKDNGRRLDLSPLNGMKIQSLVCVVYNLELSSVRGLPLLSDLACFGGVGTNLTPLAGLPLQGLTLSANWELTRLEPLKGMRLTLFACDNTLVADLSSLRGMPLKKLVCHVTQVADLSPLKGMPLEEFYCDRSLVKDLSPLAGMRLKVFSFTPSPDLKGVEAIRQMDSLVQIGFVYDQLMPAKEFWKKYDEGAFKSP